MRLCDLFAFLEGRLTPSTSGDVIGDFVLASQQVVRNSRELHGGATLEEEYVVARFGETHQVTEILLSLFGDLNELLGAVTHFHD